MSRATRCSRSAEQNWHTTPQFLLMKLSEALGVPRSSRLRGTTGLTSQISAPRGGLTTSWDDHKMAREAFSPAFHTFTGERLRNSRIRGCRVSPDRFSLTFING